MTDIEVFRHQVGTARQVLRINTARITHEESLAQPRPGGNCMNWVVGHLQHVYEQLLPLLGQPPVLGVAAVERYARGSEPLQDDGEAIEFGKLLEAWDEASRRVDAGLASLTPEALAGPPPLPGFGGTLSEMLSFVFFHQSYHTGQTGVLRRLIGKEGAVK